MVRVAFWYDRPIEYTGGLNYIKNLLFAINSIENKKLDVYVYFGKKVDPKIVKQFEQYATVIQTSLLDRGSIPWLIHKIIFKLTGSLFLINRILGRHLISVVSHADDIYGEKVPYKIVNWIPDFQPMHLPELFPDFNLEMFKKRIREMSIKSDVTVLSSQDALADFTKIASDCSTNAVVLNFVSQPNKKITEINFDEFSKAIDEKYLINGKYFFLPNQFWKHKNHEVAFEAVNLLKKRGKGVLLVCTGNLSDYRSNSNCYAEYLKKYITDNGLEENIKILGLIDYDDVLLLIRNSVSVINPSFFEGWSSSVEEAKSIGKNIILSNLNIHIEQDPPAAVYFDPENPTELSYIMETNWENHDGGPDFDLEKNALESLQERTVKYGECYQSIVLGLFNKADGK